MKHMVTKGDLVVLLVEVHPTTAANLERLAENARMAGYADVYGTPEKILAMLALHAGDSVRRTGGWEREWLAHAIPEAG